MNGWDYFKKGVRILYEINTIKNDKRVFDKDNGIVSFRYRCFPERCAIIQESIDDVVMNDFQIDYVRTLSQREQVTYVYKWMLAYCNYNTNSAYNQNIDSVFVRRNSVCTGYAKAAQYLFKLLGIESRLVFGRLNNDKEDGRHCWNIVNIEGCYYHLDICLGDLSLEDVLKKAGTTSIRRYVTTTTISSAFQRMRY